jgi:superkiller protein 3
MPPLDAEEIHAAVDQAVALEKQGSLENAREHYNLGVELRLSDDFASARQHLERAIALDPNYAVAYAELGWALHGWARMLGETKQARALRTTAVTHLERALSLEPKLYWGRLYLALVLDALDRWRRAKVHYETATERYPNESLVHAFYGDFLACRYGNVPLAERHLRKAVELDPEDPAAHFHLGKFLKRRGDYTEARRHLLMADALGRDGALSVLDEDDGNE